MASFHFHIILDIALWCFFSFAVMLPSYSLLRSRGLQGEWSNLGRVSVRGLRWFDLLGVLFFMFLLGSGVILTASEGKQAVGKLPSALVLLTPGLSFMVIALVAFVSLLGRVRYSDFLGGSPQWGRVIIVAVASVLLALTLFHGLTWLGFDQWMTERVGVKEEQLVVQMLRAGGSDAQKLAMILGACVLAPIGEELLFRGYIYPVLKKYSEPYFAAILSGVFFGVVHGHVWVVIPLSILGVILALAYEWSGSIWAPILAHSMFNSLTVIAIFSV